jgi:stearoyl-CoA desaturase (Delta-9 desaturase)
MSTTPDASINPRLTATARAPAARSMARPDVEDEKATTTQQIALGLFVVIPLLAMAAAIPALWGWGLGWHDVIIALVFYWVSGLGITVGYHRYFTHSSFKASRPLRIAMAIAGSLAIEGPVITWVSDHRRHHKFSDKEGDPHSPWRFGPGWKSLAKGLLWAHTGWLFDPNQTSQEKFSPDLLADSSIRKVSGFFAGWVAISLLAPALIGGLWGMSFHAALTAFFWASLVRVTFLHHITWSVNSVCHLIGDRPFASHDRSANVWPLAILSMGESWHNLHHADPTSARHGVRPGQVDISARLIWLLEKAGLAYDVRWPTPRRLARITLT